MGEGKRLSQAVSRISVTYRAMVVRERARLGFGVVVEEDKKRRQQEIEERRRQEMDQLMKNRREGKALTENRLGMGRTRTGERQSVMLHKVVDQFKHAKEKEIEDSKKQRLNDFKGWN